MVQIRPFHPLIRLAHWMISTVLPHRHHPLIASQPYLCLPRSTSMMTPPPCSLPPVRSHPSPMTATRAPLNDHEPCTSCQHDQVCRSEQHAHFNCGFAPVFPVLSNQFSNFLYFRTEWLFWCLMSFCWFSRFLYFLIYILFLLVLA